MTPTLPLATAAGTAVAPTIILRTQKDAIALLAPGELTVRAQPEGCAVVKFGRYGIDRRVFDAMVKNGLLVPAYKAGEFWLRDDVDASSAIYRKAVRA